MLKIFLDTKPNSP